MNTPLYRFFPFWGWLRSIAMRLLCVFGLIFSIPHFDENPPVISIVAILCSIAIFLIGDEAITIYNDRLVQADLSFYSFLFRSPSKVYRFETIKKAYLPEEPKAADTVEVGVATILIFLLPKNNFNKGEKYDPVLFELKDGGNLRLETTLGSNQRKKIVDIVNSLVDNRS